ncbi:helix-turn-helix domain-containing protein [Microbacterium hominis]|uniref:helix-turn-helix domain-containing protein n=1 Tax=Microbacterium hominis TaxID=162426 RepID=UPI001965A9EB|nr:helix-turn-helix domain-containing protein [Microbacterium hominis]QRY41670.1 helix-turn-helix domain-containing protein [Microbacterium hominis]
MPESPLDGARLLAPAQVAEMLQLAVDEVIALVVDGRLRGVRAGSPPRWRVDADSVAEYLDDQAEDARRMALWRESNAASFPELWGRGTVRNPD